MYPILMLGHLMSICKIVFYKQSATVINVLTGTIILKGGNKKLMSATHIIYLLLATDNFQFLHFYEEKKTIVTQYVFIWGI